MKRALIVILSLSMSAGSVFAAGEAEKGVATPAAKTYKIGAYFGITGGNAAYGIEARNGVVLGIEHVNANGGFNGVPVELIVYDTQCSPEEAVKLANKLISQDKVDSAIGSMNSGEVLAAAPFFNNAGIYHFGCGTAPSWMAQDWPFVFRAAMNNNNAVPIASKLVTEIGYKSIAIFHGQEDAALSTAKKFQEELEKIGVKIVAKESYDVGDTDYSAQIQKMLAAKPDGILISVIGETGGPLVKQIRQAGYDGIIFNKESFMDSQIDVAGAEASNYIAFANPYVTYKTPEDCDIPYMADYLKRYKAKYGNMVKTDSAYRGWDTVMAMWEASKLAKSNDSKALAAATHKVVAAGLGGTMDFTKGNREAYNTFNAFILVNGKNVLWSDWLKKGGYDSYKKITANAQ
ncbi:MAG: hypothetical protein A2413_10675 [Treponema sp. RIFOXYC1_FULL_61_9]|nr:MAG: hypothetical protein A2413_10675 [Treponema sp. RIFOXYC1_FULL_61_9]